MASTVATTRCANNLGAFVTALEGAGPEMQRVLAASFGVIREDRPDLVPPMNRVQRAIAARRQL